MKSSGKHFEDKKKISNFKKDMPHDKKKYTQAEKNYFVNSFFIALSLIVLVTGLITVDVRCRKMGFGNSTPVACFVTNKNGGKSFQIDTMGIKTRINLSYVDNFVEYVERKLQIVKDNLEKVLK